MVTQLRLKICETKKGTQIAEQFYTSPLKLGLPKSYGDRKKIVLMMASAGVLKGDCFDYKIRVQKNSRALLTEQSYTKLFDMGKSGQSKKNVDITVEQGASFYYKPCALIPFKNSHMDVRTNIYLDENAEFACCDIFSAGRIAMGEKFEFREFQSKIKVYVEQMLVWQDYSSLEPQLFDYTNPIYFGCYSHQGSFYYYGKLEKMNKLLEFASKKNLSINNVYFGITEAKGGICIRALAYSAQDIEDLFFEFATEIEMETE